MSGSEIIAPPVIGLTTYRQRARSGVWDVPAGFLPEVYIDGVTHAGGIATLLPPQPVDDVVAGRVIDALDGLVITGGKDVNPEIYGHDPHPATDDPARDRDAWELALLHAALRRDVPVLGICRGAQVLNVALGGTLHQHLPDVVGHSAHRQGDAVFSTSAVRTAPGTRLAALLGASTEVPCYHHQAIDRLGDGLVVNAICEDVIEGIEMPGRDFVLAVQWHPEETLQDLRLFAGLVEAAGNRAHQKGDSVTTTSVINPATEEVVRTVELLDAAAVDDAVRPCQGRPEGLGRSGSAERAAALRSFAAIVDAHIAELAALEVANAGHPVSAAEWEAGHVRDVLQYYAAAPERLTGRQIPVAGGLDVTFHEPIGVVGCHHPVELPDADRLVGFRPGPGRGQRRAAQTGRVDAADQHPPRGTGRRGRAAAGSVPGAARQGHVWWGSASSPTPMCANWCSPVPPTSAPG